MNPEEKKTSRGGARLQKKEKTPRAPRQKKPSNLTAKQKALRVLFIVLTVIAAIVVALFIFYKLTVVRPEVPNLVEQPDLQQGEEFETTGPKVYGDRKEDFFTFLVIGRDTGGGGNTDTLMVVSYDIPNQQLNVLNLPRDTMVNVPWDVKKINSVYNYASLYDKDGVDFLKEEISYLIGFQPDFTVVVEWEAVGELVDAIGPVEFDVPYDMNYDDGTQDLHIHLEAGLQEIDGDKAMQLLRWRKNNKIVNGQFVSYGGYVNGDLGRIQTQQDFISAVIDKCLSSLSVDKLPALAQIFMNNVDTRGTLTVGNIAWFAQEAILGGLSMENVNFMTLPAEGVYVYSRTVGNNQSYVVPIPDETLEMINTYFNPFEEDITLDQLDLMSVNDDGTLSSTSGYVEDTAAAGSQQSSSSQSKSDNTSNSTVSTPKPSATPKTTSTPTPSATPKVTATPRPTATPKTTATPQPSATVKPSATPTPSATPEPAATPEPTPAATPEPTPTPAATPQPDTQPDIGPGMEPVE